MKIIIVGGVAGGASCAARLRRLDEHAQILMVERGPYVSYANCGLPYHVGDVIEQESALLRRRRQHLPQHVRDRGAHRLRVRRGPAREQDGQAARRGQRRGDDRVLRQAGARARRGVDPPAAARHRPARHLRAAHRARRAHDPRMGAEGHALPRRHAPLLGLPDGAAEDARGGHRRRLHRHRDRREPDPPPLRRDAGRDGRADPRADGPGDGAHRRRPPAAPWPAPGAERRRRRLRAGRERLAEGADEVGRGVSGRPGDPGAGRAARRGAGQGRGPGDRRARRHPRRRADAHQPERHLCGRRCGRGQGPGHRRMGPGRAGRPGQPAGPHRRRRDRRARLALPRHAGHRDHRLLRRRRGLDRRQREDAAAPGRHRLSRRPTCTRTRTPATTRAPSRSR